MHRNPFTLSRVDGVISDASPTDRMVAEAKAELSAVGDLKFCPAYLVGYVTQQVPQLAEHTASADALRIVAQIQAYLIAYTDLRADLDAFTYTREDPEGDTTSPVPAHEGWSVGRYAR
jgi:hypothetical protein